MRHVLAVCGALALAAVPAGADVGLLLAGRGGTGLWLRRRST